MTGPGKFPGQPVGAMDIASSAHAVVQTGLPGFVGGVQVLVAEVKIQPVQTNLKANLPTDKEVDKKKAEKTSKTKDTIPPNCFKWISKDI